MLLPLVALLVLMAACDAPSEGSPNDSSLGAEQLPDTPYDTLAKRASMISRVVLAPRQEEEMRKCMVRRGFEYVPFFPWKEDVDPNEEIRQSLSRQRRHAYNVAWGGREKNSVAYYSKDGRLLSERNTDACLVIAFNRTRVVRI